MGVSFEDVVQAHHRIKEWVVRTPVRRCDAIDRWAGCKVFFKCENLQHIGAFKARGAYARLTQLTPLEKICGVVAYSSGNHAQAVALAARSFNVQATLVMPRDAPELKIASTRALGGQVILYDRLTENREAIAQRICSQQGAVLVPPFDDDPIIAGQGTLALEFLQEVPGLTLIATPCGGGGLLSGVAVAARGINPKIRLWGVEPETGNDMQKSLQQGYRVTISVPHTIADALQTTKPGAKTFPIIRERVEGIATVTDDQLKKAIAVAWTQMGLRVEPGGAAALAALLAARLPVKPDDAVGIVLSGGNIDPLQFTEWTGEGKGNRIDIDR